MEHQLKGKTDISKWLYINQDKSIKIKKYISEIAIFKLWIAGLSWLSRKKICQIYCGRNAALLVAVVAIYCISLTHFKLEVVLILTFHETFFNKILSLLLKTYI